MQDSAVTLMQNALVEWLEKAFKGVIRKVQPFDGLWTAEDVRTHIQSTPSLFVTWLGDRAERADEKIHTWSILLFMRVNNAKQTQKERELASHIIEFIERKLHRHKLRNEWGEIGGPLNHIKSENLWHSVPKGTGFTLYGITFEQGVTVNFDPEYNELPDFLTYFEQALEGDLKLIETIAKPREDTDE